MRRRLLLDLDAPPSNNSYKLRCMLSGNSSNLGCIPDLFNGIFPCLESFLVYGTGIPSNRVYNGLPVNVFRISVDGSGP